MIELEKHIEILLLWNDCVIVPGFGGFTASHVPAHFDEADNTFIPPLRTLGFNPKLNINDSLLVQSYTETYDISYPEALKRIESEVGELRQHLENEGQYILNDIGTLYRKDNGGTDFIPCEAGVLTPSLYSLSSFEIQKLSHNNNVYTATSKKDGKSNVHVVTDAKHVDVIENEEAENDSTDNDERTISIRLSVLRNVAAIFIAVAGFFMLSTPVNNSQSTVKMSQIDGGIISKLINTDNNSKTNAIALPNNVKAFKATKVSEKSDEDDTLEALPKSYFCLVLASQVTKRNAQAFACKLIADGYKDTRVLIEKGHSTKVTYGKFNTQAAAYNALNAMNDNGVFREAWVYEVKQ